MILSTISKRAGDMFREEMEYLGPGFERNLGDSHAGAWKV